MRMTMLEPPYEGIDAERLAKWDPPGVKVDPLRQVRLFMRHSPDLGEAMRGLAWFLLDPERSSLPTRVRELGIARVTARAGCEYQWGIHQVVYGDAAGFDEAQRYSTVYGSPDDAVWSDGDRAVLRAVDELVDHQTLSTPAFAALRDVLSEGQVLEICTVIGWYLLNSCTTNVAQLEPEGFAMRFPEPAAVSAS